MISNPTGAPGFDLSREELGVCLKNEVRSGETATRGPFALIAAIVLSAAALVFPPAATADTFISVEPVPSGDVVGHGELAMIENLGVSNLALWSNRLLNDCQIVQKVIDCLKAQGAIATVNSSNTRFLVAAGGFQGLTDPSFVFTVKDSGPGAVSQADVTVLDNALGYVVSTDGTAQFSPDNAKAYDFSLDFAVVTFDGTLTVSEAKCFFDYVGTIDAAIWSGPLAGFTQIDFLGSATNNSMLFLKPATSKREFIDGLSASVTSFSRAAAYWPLKNHGQPTTTKAGVSFPGNDWITFANGGQFLAHLGNPTLALLDDLAALRRQHLRAVARLLDAIRNDTVSAHLNGEFNCQ